MNKEYIRALFCVFMRIFQLPIAPKEITWQLFGAKMKAKLTFKVLFKSAAYHIYSDTTTL